MDTAEFSNCPHPSALRDGPANALWISLIVAVASIGLAFEPAFFSRSGKLAASFFVAIMTVVLIIYLLHLDEISRHVARGAHAILLLDRAGWHTTDKLAVPRNITLIFLPSRSPELNPVENIWQYMRQNWLSNRVFESYDAIVDAASRAWTALISQPQTIMSIGLRDWAHIGRSK